jgi:hypothetical protein
MKESNKIRFIASNYVILQGLRVVPMGICLILIALWANYQWANGMAGAIKDYTIPGVIIVGTIVSIIFIDKYYSHNFGRVKRTPESIRFEWVIIIIGSILALGAFWVDISFRLPISCFGIIVAAVLLADYIRLTWLVGGRFLIYYPLCAFFVTIASILPLFGVHKWWLVFGLENQFVSIAMIIGLFSILAGFWGHIFLSRALSSKLEVIHDNTI